MRELPEAKTKAPLRLQVGLLAPFAFLVLFALTACQVCAQTAGYAALPPGFAHLSDVDPTIEQEIRYFTDRNFLGRRVKGYEAGDCILTRQAANALARVQARLAPDFSLKVFDCYRPAAAVADFAAWAQNLADQRKRAEHYPGLDKSRLFDLGYISRASRHSRGSAVDLTIVALDPRDASVVHDEEPPCAAHPPVAVEAIGAHGTELDFGTTYDCFHDKSSTRHPGIGLIPRRNREWLVTEMLRAGFRNYAREWWHFELIAEPFAQAFDFPVRGPGPSLVKTPVPAVRPASATPRP